MEGRDHIKEYFNEKLKSAEFDVRPEIWTNVSSQIQSLPTFSSSATKSLSVTKIIGIISAASVAAAGIFYWAISDDVQRKPFVVKSAEKRTENLKIVQSNNVIDKKSMSVQQKNGFSNPEDKTFFVGNKFQENEIILNENQPVIMPSFIEIKCGNDAPQETVKLEEMPILSNAIQSSENEGVVSENEQTSEKEPSYSLGVLSNIFTPNGDGINDEFSIESSGLKDFSLVIIDQNNKTVFQANDASFVWGGLNTSGNPVPDGNYIYYLTARDSEGKIITKANKLTIKR